MADIDRLEHNGVPELLRKQVDIGSSRYAEVGAAVLTDSTGALITSSNPLPIASTGPAAGTATASVQAPVASTTSSTTILAANASRRGVILHNSDANNLRIKFGATASASSFTWLIGPGDTLVMDEPIYSGIIDGIWDADGSGSAHVTELT